ncbi:hypothetical protein UFOVP610_39 [uncultured Caudovirales phage]|uniref:Uncharacterized protein n=1 Tax=uncultured Caudovirales phage TaxID=2100421 RepID=A0A6J5N094_9CAUD|nr:hypothetical protein UFOVP610_39 [uncultured Caudovirales phage]
MIPQLKAKLEESKIDYVPEYLSGFDQAVSILMPVIECLIAQRNSEIHLGEGKWIVEKAIAEANQEILKLLEGGE